MASIFYHHGRGPVRIAEQKDPDAVWDVAFIWGDWLGGAAVASTEASAGGDLVLVGVTTLASTVISGVTYTNVEVVRVSGGTVGEVATISSKVTLATGVVEERSATVRVMEQ